MYVCMRMSCARGCCVHAVLPVWRSEGDWGIASYSLGSEIIRFGRPTLSPEEQSILPQACGFNENPCYFSLLIMTIFGFREALEYHGSFRKRILSYFCVGSAYAETDV